MRKYVCYAVFKVSIDGTMPALSSSFTTISVVSSKEDVDELDVGEEFSRFG
jgi:hypothetical protein